jgi:AcrR family transcriptional regulator
MARDAKAAQSNRSRGAKANSQRLEVATSSVEEPRTPSRPVSRTQKRVLRTEAAIEAAFVELVLEHGYDRVSVEDIAAKADLAKATFYGHYENKEALISAVFTRLIEELGERVAYRDGPWTEVRGSAMEAIYQHASEMRELYKVCLSDLRTRTSYLDTATRFSEANFQSRLTALNGEPRIPIRVMARAFAGAHLAILESWLDGEIGGSPQEVAAMQLDLLVAGFAWAQNVSLSDLGYTVAASPANQTNPKP